MPHPRLTGLVPRSLTVAGLTVGALTAPAAAFAQQLPSATDVCEAVPPTDAVAAECTAIDALAADAPSDVQTAIEAAADAAAGAAAPAPAPVPAPVPVPIPDAPAALGGDEEEEAPTPAPAPTTPVEQPAPAPSAATPTYGASGRGPEEVADPGTKSDFAAPADAPVADDADVAPSTTHPATSTATLRPNMPGLRSEAGLTLQPVQPPVVSVPFDLDAPLVADSTGVPSWGAFDATGAEPAVSRSPLAAGAAALVGSTGGALPWASATAIGLVVGAASTLLRRSRLDLADVTSTDDAGTR